MTERAKIYCFYGFNDNEASEYEKSGWVDKLCHYIERIADKQHQKVIDVQPVNVTEVQGGPEFVGSNDSVICIVSNEALSDVSWHNFMKELPTGINLILLVKEPLEVDNLPSGFADSFKLDFYLTDPVSGHVIASHDLFAPKFLNLFLVKIFDLVIALIQPSVLKSADNKNIYLALCGYDVANVRDEVRRELMLQGHKVLPEIAYPSDTENIRQAIFQDLKQCDFSVQLFGQLYDYGTYDPELSIEEIQHDIIVEYYQILAEEVEGEPGFNRIIWVAENQSKKDEKQLNFLNRLNTNLHALRKVEFVRSNTEELKDIIIGKLQSDTNKTVGFDKSTEIDEEKSIYLIGRSNYDGIHKELKTILKPSDTQLLVTDMNLDNESFNGMHRQHLVSCSGVLLVAEQNDLLWLRSKMNDVKKAYSWGRNKEYEMVAVLSEGIDQLPQDSIFNEVKLIKNKGDLAGQLLAPFINEFE